MKIVSVRMSVRLSDKRVHYYKREEKYVQIFIPYKRVFSLNFWKEEWLVEGDPFYLKFRVNGLQLERFSIFNRHSLVALQA